MDYRWIRLERIIFACIITLVRRQFTRGICARKVCLFVHGVKPGVKYILCMLIIFLYFDRFSIEMINQCFQSLSNLNLVELQIVELFSD